MKGLDSQPSVPYNYQNVFDRLNSRKLQHLFLSREGESGKKEYAVLEDLPCEECWEQDPQGFLICSNVKCSAGWHRECLPAKDRPPANAAPEDDWFCPGCKDGHQDGGNGPKEAASNKVRDGACTAKDCSGSSIGGPRDIVWSTDSAQPA